MVQSTVYIILKLFSILLRSWNRLVLHYQQGIKENYDLKILYNEQWWLAGYPPVLRPLFMIQVDHILYFNYLKKLHPGRLITDMTFIRFIEENLW